jgi:predicted nucleic acid-binding protein
MTRPLDTFAGSIIYLDTMIPYALLRGIDPSVQAFFHRIEQGMILAYTSVLTFDELAYRLLLALIRDRYGSPALDHLRENECERITELAPPVATQLRELRQFPNLVVLDVLVSDVDTMVTALPQYGLRPRDALHFAVMQRLGCLDLASNDAHFDRLPGIRRFST